MGDGRSADHAATSVATMLGFARSLVRGGDSDGSLGSARATRAVQVGTKLAGFVASLVFGGMYAATGRPRSGVLAQIVVGWWVIARGDSLKPVLPNGEDVLHRIEAGGLADEEPRRSEGAPCIAIAIRRPDVHRETFPLHAE